MSQEELTKLAIAGLIAQQPEEDRKKIEECVAKLRDFLAEYGDYGLLAITLVGAELQLKAAESGC